MVEIEIGVLRSQCLDRRIASHEHLISEIGAWERQRNASGARIKWMFTTAKARAKNRPRLPRTRCPPRAPNQRVIITVQRY
jgi:hypothetical protein